MKIKIYAMYAIGRSPLDNIIEPSYRDITGTNRKIVDFLLSESFHMIDGCYETVPSKGILLHMHETFSKENILVETGFRIDREKGDLSILEVGIATTPLIIKKLADDISYVAMREIKLCSSSDIWLKRDLELFRNAYRDLIRLERNPSHII